LGERAGLVLVLAVVAGGIAATPALPQSGSTGGTLGKTDKSASGTRPATPAQPPAAGELRAAGCGPILGKWLWSNGVTTVVNADKTTTQSDGHSASVICADGVYTFTWVGIWTVRMIVISVPLCRDAKMNIPLCHHYPQAAVQGDCGEGTQVQGPEDGWHR